MVDVPLFLALKEPYVNNPQSIWRLSVVQYLPALKELNKRFMGNIYHQ
jgi:hypothetical protein